MSRGGRRRVSSVVVLLALLGLSCGSTGHDRSDAGTASSVVSQTTSLTGSRATAVLDSYRRFWDLYLAASNPMNPTDPRLRDVATGEELRSIGGAFLARQSAGEVFRGTIDLNPEVVKLTADRATIRDCHDSRIGIYDAKTGVLKEPGGGKALVTVGLVLEGGVWKVAAMTHEADACAAP